jgi:hypothetical protein
MMTVLLPRNIGNNFQLRSGDSDMDPEYIHLAPAAQPVNSSHQAHNEMRSAHTSA